MHVNHGRIGRSGTRLALTLIAFAAGGCGGKAAPTGGESSSQRNPGPQESARVAADGGGSLKSGSTSSPPGEVGVGGGASLNSGFASSPPGEVGQSGPVWDAGNAEDVTPWKAPDCDDSYYRRVELQVTNTGSTDVYLAVMGRGCTEYAIDHGDGGSVPLLTWGGVACGADPDSGYADTFQRLPPGATYEDNWFATRVVADPSGCGSEECLVEPGGYRVTFGYELSPPPGCSNGDSDRPDLWYCPTRPGLTGNPVYAPLCPTSGVVTKEFVLPPPQPTDAGDLTTVSVPLNAAQ
jgi:hypothetical protein